MAQVETTFGDGWVPPNSFGARLAQIRQALGWNQTEAALKCGLKGPTWATWEAGASPRNMDEVVDKIAKTTRVNRNWLMWGSASGYTRTADADRHLDALPTLDPDTQPPLPFRPALTLAELSPS